MTRPVPIVQTVMIVDDDVALRTAFAIALERVGYRIVSVTGSPEVIELIHDEQPALILLDNHMPTTSGVELIKHIRQRWSMTELPVVLISGSSIQGEIEEAMQAGANDFRRKPVDLHDLIDTVGAVVGTPVTRRAVPEGSSS